ncbi:DAK2 domain-containing protein [Candidatus Avoscillospira sp. LCP25S3_F1]|uniref:DAK2 domain-containing protein n=1 Tax=Candidatus Avoscillospira sp. LCP25S3_F1 TaxID=3438825 RepID=UPI003F8F336D
MRQTMDGAAFRRMMISAAASIEIHKQQINELNVFPVPDGDTGTNMSLTINTACGDLRKLEDPTLTKAADATASALLRGARGNSGVILSLLFRGFAKALKGKEEGDGTDFAAALNAGVEAAYKAVMKPAEGTILTVSRVAGTVAALEAQSNRNMEHVLTCTIAAAKDALAETLHQNPVLEKAGVVDAGGMGFVVILEGMLSSLQGVDVVAPTESTPDMGQEQANFSDFSTEDITFGYCTEFIISRENDKDPAALREFLSQMGDSLVLVDDDEIIKVHVHTNNPGTAIEEALTYGSLVTVKIENMRLQHTEKVMNERDLEPKIAPPEKKYGIVAVCAGDGIASAFRDLGVDGIIQGGQTMNPSTEDILREIQRTPSEIVFVFPNNKNIIMAAEQTVDLCEEKQVIVLPSKTIPQGITALLSFDPEGEVSDNVETMTAAMETVTTMQITYAARNSDFDGYDIHEGDYLALYGGSLFGTDRNIEKLLNELALRVAQEDKEFITIFYGEDIDEKKAQKAAAIFEKRCPGAEINLLNGGQPVYYYLISAE